MLTRISKLEELVNVLVSKNGSNQSSRGSSLPNANDITYNCAPYTIPSPRSYETGPPPYTVFESPSDVTNAINLTAYTVDNNDFSDSVESVESDGGLVHHNTFTARTASRPSLSPVEREMSPVYDHLNRAIQYGYFSRG